MPKQAKRFIIKRMQKRLIKFHLNNKIVMIWAANKHVFISELLEAFHCYRINCEQNFIFNLALGERYIFGEISEDQKEIFYK